MTQSFFNSEIRNALIMSLRQKFLSGLFWSAVERFGQQGLQFVITIIIARILTPADYGLIAMLAIFIAVARSFVDSGFGSALIQKQKTTQIDFSTIFYFNIAVSILFYFILFFTAPLIAKFYNQPILIPITRVMSLNIVISSFGLIQNTILTKNINFKTLTKISMLSIVVSGAIGIFMAYKGFGVWALVFQILSSNFIRTFSLWLFNKWRPILAFSLNSLKSLFSYGSKLLASGLLNQIFENIYKLVIGRYYSPFELGFYSQAKRIQELPVRNSLSILQRVTFPVYSTIQNENVRLKKVYRKTIKGIIYFNFPLMIGLAVLAPLLIKVLLTQKWLPAVPYLQLLCFAGLIYPLSSVNLNILKVKGRTDIFFYLEVVKKLIIALAIIITLKMGVLTMVIGQVIASYICFLLNIYYSGRVINYSVKEQLLDILPYLCISIIMGVCMWSCLYLISLQPIISLLLALSLGIISYYLFSRLLRIEAYFDVISVLSDFSRKKLHLLLE